MPRIPPKPFTWPPYIRDRILSRLSAGERIGAICGEAGMPCQESVTGWARADPAGFGAGYARAKSDGDWRRRFQFDEVKARAIVARIAAGESLEAVLRDPATPGRAAVRYWLATDHGFAEEVARLRAVRREERAGAIRRRRWRAYDAALADKILYRVGQGAPLRRVLVEDARLPCLSVLARWRREQPQFDADLRVCMKASRYRVRATRLWSPELEEEILSRICEGASFRQVAADPQMPCLGTLSNWMRRKPAFAEAVRQMCEMRDETLHDEMYRIAMQATEATVGEAKRRIGRLKAKAGRLRRTWVDPAEVNDDEGTEDEVGWG